MKSGQIRKAFLDYFKEKAHETVRSSPLIPAEDPSLLFTNAGMVQFKKVFLGEESRPYKRAATCQKCMRAGGKHNDIENVGYTARHHTFFEMLGNFSFGDYFKREAIGFAWELLTKRLGLPSEKLWVTIYEEDDEAEMLWREVAGIAPERIVRLGARDNFWQMADTGPCGPCSEIIYDQGEEVGCGKPGCAVGCDCDRYLEIWNLVFMQYNRDEAGSLTPLPRPSIDTGMGLERIAAVLQDKRNNFDTDIFAGIISSIESITGARYGADPRKDTAIRVIADHMRAITFLIADGVTPSNEGRGYVLRRIIRRAARYARKLDAHGGKDQGGPVLWKLVDSVAGFAADVYPEIGKESANIKKTLRFEEERFGNTLDQGMRILEDLLSSLRGSGGKLISGAEVFKLYDTFGFPVDIVRDVASEEGFTVDEEGFNGEMRAQKERARASWVVDEGAAESVYKELASEVGPVVFAGYDTLDADTVVKAIVKHGHAAEEISEGQEAEVIVERTPFYAESGGQTGDTGVIITSNMAARVMDTRKPVEGLTVQHIKMERGRLRVWDKVSCHVDVERRAAITRNHTATHLLHAALKEVLGDHVKQAGSLVEPDRLRFDFTHFTALTPEEIAAVEDIVNSKVLEDMPVKTDVMKTDHAIAAGATALFGEKYGDTVRVVAAGAFSRELCGGTHVHSTGNIGLFLVTSEGSVASGIRRIEAITGLGSLAFVRDRKRELKEIAQALKTDKPLEKAQELLDKMKALEKELEGIRAAGAKDIAKDLAGKIKMVDGVKVLSEKVSGQNFGQKELRELADVLRDRIGSGVIMLANSEGALLATVTKDLSGRVKAGDILGEVARLSGGRGGGKPELAQGGAKELEKLDSALEKVYDIVGSALKK